MADQQNDPTGTQDGAEDQSQADTTSTQVGRRQQQGQREQTSDTAGQSGQSDQGSDVLTRDEARKLRNEANALRRRVRELEQADMTEQERLNANLTELQSEHGQLLSRVQIAERQAVEFRAQIELYKAGATHPELIASRMTADDLADEKATKAAVDKLKKDYPDLFGADVRGSADGANSGSSVRRATTMNEMVRAGWRSR